MLPVAILAGGLATRLRPVSSKVPKSLIPIAGQPFVFHQVQYLKSQGVKKVVLCVGHLGEMIENVLGDGHRFGLSIKYSYDGPGLVGTGGALKKAADLLGKEYFVLYGDSFLPINFQQVLDSFRICNKPVLMTVLKNQGKWDKSNTVFKDGVVLEYNKRLFRSSMEYIDYGLSVLTASVLGNELEPVIDLSDVFTKLGSNNKLAGFEVYERFYEIGTFEGIVETEKYINSYDICK
jgi:MurNAc alpha-1-phosphate uridylyltransferase